MQKAQKIVAAGALSGVVTMILAVTAFYYLLPDTVGYQTHGDQFLAALRYLVFALLPLLIGVITIGNERFLSDAIDPLLHKENRVMEINARFVDNTLQQTVLFVVALLTLSTIIEPTHMRIIPALVIVFVIARAVFWIGYRINPLYRAPGMAATGYMNAGIIAYCIWSVFF